MARSSLRVSLVAGAGRDGARRLRPAPDNGGSGSSSAAAATPRPRPPPRTSAAWTRWSRRPRRRARSTSSRCRRTGPTTATSSRRFEDKYGIKVNSASPTPPARTRSTPPSSSRAPTARPTSSTSASPWRWPTPTMFAPYKVATWDDIPADFKDADGAWVNDYGGYMSIGYDSEQGARTSTSLDDLLGPGVQGQGRAQRRPDPGRRRVQRRDDGRRWPTAARPTTSRPASTSSASSRRPATSCPVDPTSGHHRVRPDPGRHRLGLPERGRDRRSCRRWKVVVPDDAVVAGYYFQAINKDAPHPAAARLWEEFLYSDEGQNLWLAGGARPVRADAMVKAGTHRQGGVRRAARGQRHAGDPDRRADREGDDVPRRPTGPRPSAEHAHRRRSRDVSQVRPARRRALGACCRSCSTCGLPGRPDRHGGGGRVPGGRPVHAWSTSQALFERHACCTRCGTASCCRAVSAAGRRGVRRLAGLPRRHPAGRPALLPAGGHRGLRRARPVRRRHAGLRVHRHARLLRGGHRGAARPRFGIDIFGVRLAVRAARADPGLHLLPDPADGDRLPAGARRHPPAVARGGGQPRRAAPGSTGARSAGPLLLPAFLGSTLLLFANAFAAYATAAALVSQGSPILPLLIRSALTSEVVLGRQNLAFALAFEMVVVVAVVMTLYACWCGARARWLQ